MIVGYHETFVDFDEKIAVIGFVQGCNFRCWFCSNWELTLQQDVPNKMRDEFIQHVIDNIDYYEGVVISGGEPTIHGDHLVELCKILKGETKLPIKVDTNGSRPEVLGELIDYGLIDLIAIDIKHDIFNFNKMTETIGRDYEMDDCRKLIKSIKMLKESYLNKVVFRTTLIPTLNELDFIKVIRFLADGWSKNCEFHLQKYDSIVAKFQIKGEEPSLRNFTDILEAHGLKYELKNFD